MRADIDDWTNKRFVTLNIGNPAEISKRSGLGCNQYDTSHDTGGLEIRHLRSIATTYKQKTGRKLVYVMAANSYSAALKPSEQYTYKLGGGQSKAYQRDQAQPDQTGEPDIWVIGIPTVTLQEKTFGGVTQIPMTQKELDHYIAGCYFQLGKGATLCFPTRSLKSARHNRDSKLTIPSNEEYAFGGTSRSQGFVEKFGTILEDALNKLDLFAQRLVSNEAELIGTLNMADINHNTYHMARYEPRYSGKEFYGAYQKSVLGTGVATFQSKTEGKRKVGEGPKDPLLNGSHKRRGCCSIQ